MAYAYKKIEDMLDPSKQGSTNLFEGSTPSANADGGSQAAPGGSSYNKGSAQPSQPTPQANSNELASPTSQRSSSLYSAKGADKAALEANIGKEQQIPGLIGKLGQDIGQRRADLQAESDKWYSGQKDKQKYGVTPEEIKGAQDNTPAGEGQYNKVGELLGQKFINPIDEFKTPEMRIPNEQLISNDSGLKEILSRGKGTRYTPGESELDLQLLKRQPGFTDKLIGISRDQKALIDEAKSLKESRTKELGEYGKTALAKAQEEARTGILGEAKSIEDRQTQEAKEAQDYYARLMAKDPSLRDEILKSKEYQNTKRLAEESLRANLGPYGYAEYLKFQNLDNPEEYLKVDPEFKYDDPKRFYDEEESRRFNRLHGLLGDKEARVSGEYGKGVNKEDLIKLDDESRRKLIDKSIEDKIKSDLTSFNRGSLSGDKNTEYRNQLLNSLEESQFGRKVEDFPGNPEYGLPRNLIYPGQPNFMKQNPKQKELATKIWNDRKADEASWERRPRGHGDEPNYRTKNYLNDPNFRRDILNRLIEDNEKGFVRDVSNREYKGVLDPNEAASLKAYTGRDYLYDPKQWIDKGKLPGYFTKLLEQLKRSQNSSSAVEE